MISITQYLYRIWEQRVISVPRANRAWRPVAGLLAIALLSLSGAAQVLQDRTHDQQPPPSNAPRINTKPSKRGPRAIAVLEFLPGGRARLVPVALWIDDHYYDASLYGSNPEPMALQPETVYEATDYGEPTGLFTVTNPTEIKGNWVGDGSWKPQLALDDKLAKQAAKQPIPKSRASSDDDERPILRRPGSTESSSGSGNSGAGSSGAPSASAGKTASSAGSAPPPSDDDDSDRPTLKASPTASAPASQPTVKNDASQGQPSSPQNSGEAGDENDPNRPVLRRGAPAAQPSNAASAASAQPASPALNQSVAKMQAAQGKLMATMNGLGHRSYPAVSDAGTYETRSLLYAMNSAERSQKSQQMIALALDDIRAFISKRNAPALPKNATITDYELRAFDLDYSNSPTLVLTARLAVPTAKALRGGDFDYFATVVARVDINGQPIKIFSSVTDSNHLDAFSRMEIIDAVDADANGRGDLLFRQYSDTGINYSLYRVFPYQMQKIFEGGSGV